MTKKHAIEWLLLWLALSHGAFLFFSVTFTHCSKPSPEYIDDLKQNRNISLYYGGKNRTKEKNSPQIYIEAQGKAYNIRSSERNR